jgi:hypothetical protein
VRIARIARLLQHRHGWRALLELLDELDARAFVQFAFALELDVRDHAKHVVLELLVLRQRLLVGLGQEHLGPRAHTQELVDLDEVLLGDQTLRLLEDLRVQDRQVSRVVVDRVLHEEDHAHESDAGVFEHVHAVFDVLDHREEHLGVPVPDEDAIEACAVFVSFGEQRELVVVVQQEQHREVGSLLLDAVPELERRHLIDTHRQDDHVVAMPLQHLEGLFPEGHGRHARRNREVELVVLAEDQLGELALSLEDEGVIHGRDEKDLAHLVVHQIVVDLGVRLVRREQLGDGLLVSHQPRILWGARPCQRLPSRVLHGKQKAEDAVLRHPALSPRASRALAPLPGAGAAPLPSAERNRGASP